VCRDGFFHVIGARIEHSQEIPVSALKVLEDFFELGSSRLRVEREHALNDMVDSRLVSWIEVTRFRRRLELAHDDPRGVRVQVCALPLQKLG
jgi:hypothetical protein